MGLRNYTGALALSALLGCSAPSESRNSDYVTTELPNSKEEALLVEYAPRHHSSMPLQLERSDNIFSAKKVIVTYKTNSGPGSSYPLSPVDSSLVEGVQRELVGRRAYAFPVGNPNSTYQDINLLLGSPRPGLDADLVVVADRAPNLSGIDEKLLDRVYTVSLKDGSYQFERARK